MLKKSPFDVPCNGCTRCCKGDAVRLLPEDDPSKYKTEPHPYREGQLMLAHAESGDCFYLGPTGCVIHETKPLMCRQMDCRRIAKTFTYTEIRKLDAKGAVPIAIWRRGKDLMKGVK